MKEQVHRKLSQAGTSLLAGSKLESVRKVIKKLRRDEQGLLNFSQHKITYACAEGFNSAIQLIKANAHGFRSFANYRAKILFYCGKLNLAIV